MEILSGARRKNRSGKPRLRIDCYVSPSPPVRPEKQQGQQKPGYLFIRLLLPLSYFLLFSSEETFFSAPVHSAVAQRYIINILLKLLCQILFFQTPFPVDSHGRRLIHPCLLYTSYLPESSSRLQHAYPAESAVPGKLLRQLKTSADMLGTMAVRINNNPSSHPAKLPQKNGRRIGRCPVFPPYGPGIDSVSYTHLS